MLKNLVKSWLLSRDMVISHPPGTFDVGWMKLAAAKRRGLRITRAIDGGASDGGWAREFKKIFPDARILCIEPREECRSGLEQTARELGGIDWAGTLIGDTEGTVTLNVADVQSSMLKNASGRSFGTTKDYPITTLDKLVQQKQFPPPDLIKLDLQGAELQALRGAEECLKQAQALLIETSFIPIQQGSPLVFDIVTFCHDRGFRVYDIPALWHRPLDGALAQGDFLFLKEGHPLIADARWSESLG